VSRILIYSDRGGLGGAEQINHRLALAWRRLGHTVALAEPEQADTLKRLRRENAIAHFSLPSEDIYDWEHPAPSLSDASAAEEVFARFQPDLLLFADSFPFASLAAKQAAHRLGLGYLVLIHCVQPEWAEQYADFLPALPPLYYAARGVIAVSQDNLQLLRRHFRLPENLGEVITNGRPAAFFEPCNPLRRERERHALGLAPDQLLLLSIGRFELAKGWPELLAAIPRLRRHPVWPRLRLLWVGKGTLEPRMRKFARLFGNGQIILLPQHPDIPALLDAADLLVHPARFEGMPLVVLEAMAKALPIIATSVSGIPEALQDAGVLLPDAAADIDLAGLLADAMASLAGDPARRWQLGHAAKTRAQAHFTEKHMLDRYQQCLRRALGS
jgi:glycosyltransferase involved in cell wall biosynthesis